MVNIFSLTIKNKLYLSMGLVLVATLGLTAFNSFIVKQTGKVEEERLLVEKINSGMLQLRRNEKDFLARNAIKYQGKFEKNYNLCN